MRAVSASSVRGRKVSFVGTVVHEEPGSLGLESHEGPCLCMWPRWDHLLESRLRQGWHLCSQPAGGGELCVPRGPAGPHRGGRGGRGRGQGWCVAKASSLGGMTGRGLAEGVWVPPWHTVLYPGSSQLPCTLLSLGSQQHIHELEGLSRGVIAGRRAHTQHHTLPPKFPSVTRPPVMSGLCCVFLGSFPGLEACRCYASCVLGMTAVMGEAELEIGGRMVQPCRVWGALHSREAP